MGFNKLIGLLITILVSLFIADVLLGSVYIPPTKVMAAFLESSESTDTYIINHLRLPRALMAVIAGSGLSISGLLMQSLFRNPLAGPFVLGISSGAGLGVAIVVLGATAMGWAVGGSGSIIIASIMGSTAVLILTLFISTRIKDTMGLLIIGLMVGSLSSAIIGILSYLSTSEELRRYVFWSLGSLGGVDWWELAVLSIILAFGIAGTGYMTRKLNLMLLGEEYARSLGVNLEQVKWLIIVITSCLAGSITAFAGPIAFVGLAVPHLCRLFLPSVNFRVILPVCILVGASLMLACDIIAQLPFTNYTLPLNAVTSLMGAPVVIWLIIRKRGLQF